VRQLFDRWLVVGSLVLVTLLLLNAGVAYRNTVRLHRSSDLVAHTNQVLFSLETLLSTLKDAETGQRGFLITGDEGYLKPYENALSRVDRELAEFKELTRDNSRHQARIPRLEELIKGKLDELAFTVALRKQKGLAAAQAEVATHLGKNRMDAIRALVAEMDADERALERERRSVNEQSYRIALGSLVLATVVGFVGVLGFGWVMRRHLKARFDADAVLAEQREWFRTTLASIGDAVIATDTQGQVTFLNSVAASLTGWSQSEAAGQPIAAVFNIINEQSRNPVEDPTRRALAQGTVVGLANHTLLIARDGSELPIDDSAAPIRDAQGQVVGAVLVFRDITQRKASEQILREADRRKDEFLATLSHELRNPLAPIRNAVQILNAKGPSELEFVWARDVIDRQVAHMTRLVDDLLDVSRIAANKLRVQKERVALATIVEMAVETSQPAMGAANHQLTVSLPLEAIHLEADATRLAQVFANLLNNAARYTENGGAIALVAEREGDDAVVSVRDNGIGIHAEIMPHIFEAFSQGSTTLERSQSGLGIGLALSKALVELHEGTITARSNGPGKGSEFMVRLPLVRTASVRDQEDGIQPAAPEWTGS